MNNDQAVIDRQNTVAKAANPELDSAIEEVLLIAQEHFRSNRILEAENLYHEVLKVAPDHPAAHHDLGLIEIGTLGAAAVLPRFKRAVQFNPQNEQYWVTYFDALTQLEDMESAKVALTYGQQYGLKTETARVLASEFGLVLDEEISIIRRLPKLQPLDMGTVKNFSSDVFWNVRNKARFDELVAEMKTLVGAGYYFGDNFITWGRNNSLLEDTPFVEAWQSNITNDADYAIAWRRYILACSAHHCVQLEGDFVECGVYNGSGIKTVMDYIGGTEFPKTFWGYDTFDYNPVEGHAFEGQAPGFYDQVCARFADYKQVRLVKGFIPDAFEQGVPEKIAYLHIDLNNAEGEIATFEHLFDKVVSGGMVVLDDYEWGQPYRPQKEAEDKWLEARGYRVFPLPTGQGFFIKR